MDGFRVVAEWTRWNAEKTLQLDALATAASEGIALFRDRLSILVGSVLEGTLAGISTGYTVKFRFRPEGAPKLVGAVRIRKEDPTCAEMMLYTSWRVERRGRLVAGSANDNRRNGPMLSALKALQRRKVLRFTLDDPIQDLTLEFTGGYVLRCFAEKGSDPRWEGFQDHYVLFYRRESFCLDPQDRFMVHKS